MANPKNIRWLLVLLSLGWATSALAQQAPPAASAVSQPLLTPVDTVAAVHTLFQAKRKTSGLALAAAPVALGLTVVAAAVAVLSQLDSSSDATLPVAGMVAGLGSTVALLSRYSRYTKSNEADIVEDYEKTHFLPGWVKRNMAEQRRATP